MGTSCAALCVLRLHAGETAEPARQAPSIARPDVKVSSQPCTTIVYLLADAFFSLLSVWHCSLVWHQLQLRLLKARTPLRRWRLSPRRCERADT